MSVSGKQKQNPCPGRVRIRKMLTLIIRKARLCARVMTMILTIPLKPTRNKATKPQQAGCVQKPLTRLTEYPIRTLVMQHPF